MSFFETLYCFFTGQDSSVLKEKGILKRIAKEINQSKYRKFYKTGSGEINPAFGVFFYDMYKALIPARSLMQNAEKSSLLKQYTIEAFMDKELREVHNRLVPETIMEQAQSAPPQELAGRLEQDLAVFSSAFSSNQMHLIDQYYRLIMNFHQLASFDFFPLLKKMDLRLREKDFAYQPQFKRIPGKNMAEKIKDFLELPYLEAKWDEWKTVFEILKKYKNGIEVVNLPQWKKLVSSILDVQKSDIMVFMVRHIDQDIKWQKKLNLLEEDTSESITEVYIKAKTAEVHGCIDKIINDNRVSKRDGLANSLFGTTSITRLRYYTNNNNEIYLKRNIAGFIYTDALNYVKGFLIDYKDVQELCDLFLIRGQWVSQDLSRQMSQELHRITDIAEAVAEFDGSLADGGRNGSKLKNHLLKSKTDRNQTSYLKTALEKVNEEAKNMISDTISSFTIVATHLKELYADYEKSHPQLIVNWKEIESTSEIPIRQRIQQHCKSIASFVQLMQFFI